MEKQTFNYDPWKIASEALNNKLDITEPPCKHCKHFKPRVVTNKVGEFGGISLCAASNMHRDFSCFEQ